MKKNTSQLTDRELNWALAQIAGLELTPAAGVLITLDGMEWVPIRRWGQLGPFIKKYNVELIIKRPGQAQKFAAVEGKYCGRIGNRETWADTQERAIAGAVVSTFLGTTVDLPDWI